MEHNDSYRSLIYFYPIVTQQGGNLRPGSVKLFLNTEADTTTILLPILIKYISDRFTLFFEDKNENYQNKADSR